MKRTLITLAVVTGLIAGAWVGGIFRKPNASQAAAAAATTSKHPRIELPENNFDFGVIETGQTGRRSFEIRNVGDADLTLKLRETTCKCTLAKLEKTVIPPGGRTEIELEWQSDEPNEGFYQGAKIETNDPEKRRFDLRVEGRIRNRFGIWPKLVFFTDVARNSTHTMHVHVYSQFYREVRITKVHSTLDGVTAKLSDAAPSTAPPFETQFLRDLVIECRTGSKPGPFHGKLAIEYEGVDREGRTESGLHDLEFGGETVGDFSVHGRDVVGRLLNLGTPTQAVGAKANAYIHYRGDATDLKLTFAKATPGFVQVHLGEPQKLSPTVTRFPVEVVVPPDSPLTNMSSTAAEGLGSVVLSTNHPDYPEVQFQLSLVILP